MSATKAAFQSGGKIMYPLFRPHGGGGGALSGFLLTAVLLAAPWSAHAVIGVDSDGNTTGAVVYAKETLLKSSTIEKDGTTYYVVSESARTAATIGDRYLRQLELDLRVPVPYAIGASSNMAVTVELEGMVFGQNITGTPYAARRSLEVRWNLIAERTNLTYTVYAGGAQGDSSHTVRITTGSGAAIPTTDELYISFRSLGILPDTPGTIRVTFLAEVENAIGETVRDTTTYVLRDAVKAVSLLEVEGTASDATADLTEGGLKFEAGPNVRADGLAASVGRVSVGASSTFTALDPFDDPYIHLGGERVLAADGTWIIALGRSVDSNRRTARTLVRKLASELEIGVEGPTEFLGEDGKVYVSPSADCAPSRDSIVGEDGNRVSTNDLAAGGRYVCIEVDGETEIPEAGPYLVRVMHDSDTAAFPAATVERELGSIGLGGSIVRLPFLTTNERYNNRIVVWNRSGRTADYSLSFTPSEGTTATAKEAATGTFPVGRTILNVRDVVTLVGEVEGAGGNTAADLSIVGPAALFEVATRNTTRADGSTDTVVYEVR